MFRPPHRRVIWGRFAVLEAAPGKALIRVEARDDVQLDAGDDLVVLKGMKRYIDKLLERCVDSGSQDIENPTEVIF